MTELNKKTLAEFEKQIEKEEDGNKKKKNKFKTIFKFFSYTTIFLIVCFVLFPSQILISEEENFLYRLPIIGQIKHLVESSDKKLKNEDTGRINILLLGMGGKNHQGGLLTDTIMLASLNIKQRKAALLSIPRDMSVPVEGSGWIKINNINAFAEIKEKGSGGVAVSQTLSDILSIPVDYYVRLDFQGFINIINKLGGIEIYVENTIDDYSYPITGQEEAEDYASRFEHLYIEKGWQKMDGELTLKYARSRHTAGIEGSDFARARRQQKVIQAVKEKFSKTNFLFKPMLINDIVNELIENVSTNLKIWEMIKIWNIFKNLDPETIMTKVLDNSPDGLLYNIINEGGAYVLLPRNGDFEEIKYLVHNIFDEAPENEKEEVTTERATLEIRNGTWINGLANRKAVDLEKYGFDVLRVGNSSRRNFEKSIIYDLTFGDKIKSLSILKEKTNASVSFNLPQWLKDDIMENTALEISPEKPDFILILGQDADATHSGAENIEQ